MSLKEHFPTQHSLIVNTELGVYYWDSLPHQSESFNWFDLVQAITTYKLVGFHKTSSCTLRLVKPLLTSFLLKPLVSFTPSYFLPYNIICIKYPFKKTSLGLKGHRFPCNLLMENSFLIPITSVLALTLCPQDSSFLLSFICIQLPTPSTLNASPFLPSPWTLG